MDRNPNSYEKLPMIRPLFSSHSVSANSRFWFYSAQKDEYE